MSYAKNLFEGVPKKHANMSRFNLSHEWKHDFTLGKIIPVLCEPTMPGDHFEISSEFMFRFEPLYYPIMAMVNMTCNYFWVPNRILWRATDFSAESANGWVNFITMTTELDPPRVSPDMQTETDGSLNDTILGYMGLPYTRRAVGWADTIEAINALPLFGYLAIIDEYYRNPQLEPGVWFNPIEGDNTSEMDTVLGATTTGRWRVFSSKWEKDYFTSAIPQPQTGDPIKVPFVVTDRQTSAGEEPIFRKASDGTPAGAGAMSTDASGEPQVAGSGQVYYDPQSWAADIKQLRLAEALQTFKERLMKISNRYRDYIKGMFGRDPQPGQVDVPVWFGYYSGRVQISDVTQTATTQITETQYNTGDFVGRMDLYEKGKKFNVTCMEHGWIIALMEVKPNTSYGQGIDRFWRWTLPTDYPLDIFAGIGDQEIRKEEILYNSKTTDLAKNNETFGYIPRYSEMRYRNSKFGSNLQAQSWGLGLHFGRWWDPEFTVGSIYDRLVIDENFVNTKEQTGGGIEGSLRVAQIFKSLPTLFNNEVTQNQIFGHIMHSIYVNRALPMFSTPKLGV